MSNIHLLWPKSDAILTIVSSEFRPHRLCTTGRDLQHGPCTSIDAEKTIARLYACLPRCKQCTRDDGTSIFASVSKTHESGATSSPMGWSTAHVPIFGDQLKLVMITGRDDNIFVLTPFLQIFQKYSFHPSSASLQLFHARQGKRHCIKVRCRSIPKVGCFTTKEKGALHQETSAKRFISAHAIKCPPDNYSTWCLHTYDVGVRPAIFRKTYIYTARCRKYHTPSSRGWTCTIPTTSGDNALYWSPYFSEGQGKPCHPLDDQNIHFSRGSTEGCQH